ncbi:MAG: hypothetical protein JXB49_01590 [Bacteroidales bacterium]|nr:hypothetical protein [Bacteroidales bacterium]
MKHYIFYLFFFTIILEYCSNQDIRYFTNKPDEVTIPYLFKSSISQGLRVHLYSNKLGKSVPKQDLDATFTVGWEEEGLFFLFFIEDDSVLIDERSVWKSDAVEIFITDSFGSNNMIQYTISYFPDDTFRCIIGDYRNRRDLRKDLPEKKCNAVLTENGYTIRSSILFKDIGLAPKEGDIIGLQVYVRDMDKKDDEDVITYSWHNGSQTYLTPLSMFPVKLVKEKTETPLMSTKYYVRDMNSLVVTVTGEERLASKILSIDDQKEVFKIVDNYARAEMTLHLKDHIVEKNVYVDDSLISVINTLISPLEFSVPNADLKFENEIRYYEMMDQLFPPPDSAILFAGSSSFRRWQTLTEDFQELTVINRGFGGSTMQYLLYYFPRLVSKYKPSKILVYEGDNDIAYGLSPSDFVRQCHEFIHKVETELPGTDVYFLSIKPSPARSKYQDKYVEANNMLKDLCNEYSFVSYIDVFTPMLDKECQVREDIFTYDNLHLNDEGYAIWRDEVLKILIP